MQIVLPLQTLLMNSVKIAEKNQNSYYSCCNAETSSLTGIIPDLKIFRLILTNICMGGTKGSCPAFKGFTVLCFIPFYDECSLLFNDFQHESG